MTLFGMEVVQKRWMVLAERGVWSVLSFWGWRAAICWEPPGTLSFAAFG